ncbi:hypothetical protein M8C21_008717 [Ambrosia artemisiifolia]|uniref:Uncharacterized protein n=1 Tax=Ambrosia artemisiifolia TaxID=4212 RepID=A0AAD5CJS9_AMBAR|nr:hypothetical protein M8C21_008717 [Ambrosia artemisiifolia]
MNTVTTKGSVSCTGDNGTPMSCMTNAMETPSSQDGELQSKMLKDNEFKRNLEKAFEGDEDSAMSATKPPKVYKPNEDSMAGNEGLLIPKTEKL